MNPTAAQREELELFGRTCSDRVRNYLDSEVDHDYTLRIMHNRSRNLLAAFGIAPPASRNDCLKAACDIYAQYTNQIVAENDARLNRERR